MNTVYTYSYRNKDDSKSLTRIFENVKSKNESSWRMGKRFQECICLYILSND